MTMKCARVCVLVVVVVGGDGGVMDGWIDNW